MLQRQKGIQEVTVLFENLWLQKTEVMSREEYRECMIPFYGVCVEIVQELMAECSMDGVSKIYLSGDRSNDISLWEYLEGWYQAEVCILPENYEWEAEACAVKGRRYALDW